MLVFRPRGRVAHFGAPMRRMDLCIVAERCPKSWISKILGWRDAWWRQMLRYVCVAPVSTAWAAGTAC